MSSSSTFKKSRFEDFAYPIKTIEKELHEYFEHRRPDISWRWFNNEQIFSYLPYHLPTINIITFPDEQIPESWNINVLECIIPNHKCIIYDVFVQDSSFLIAKGHAKENMKGIDFTCVFDMKTLKRIHDFDMNRVLYRNANEYRDQFEENEQSPYEIPTAGTVYFTRKKEFARFKNGDKTCAKTTNMFTKTPGWQCHYIYSLFKYYKNIWSFN
jgi:hypothetical protein